MDTTALARFLQAAHWPELTEQQPTFFSIAGIAHKELSLSNVYAFFLSSTQPHGLGPLLLEALFDVVRTKAPALLADWPVLAGPVRVAREYAVDKQQRLDLLVHDGESEAGLHGASYAVLIENKVNHWLANDLDNYMASVRGPARRVGVVLGLRREQPAAPWLFVGHAELARAVLARLGPHLNKVQARYLPILLQFLEHLSYMSEHSDNFKLAFDFAMRHRTQLAQAQHLLGQLTGQGLSAVIAEAFGDGYEQQNWFADRVDIRLTQPAPLRYVVFFGHVLDLTQAPGFTITLYAPEASRTQAAEWQDYLQSQGATSAKLLWFPFDSLVIGREYPILVGSSLSDLQHAVRAALLADWQPLEVKWRALSKPPARNLPINQQLS